MYFFALHKDTLCIVNNSLHYNIKGTKKVWPQGVVVGVQGFHRLSENTEKISLYYSYITTEVNIQTFIPRSRAYSFYSHVITFHARLNNCLYLALQPQNFIQCRWE